MTFVEPAGRIGYLGFGSSVNLSNMIIRNDRADCHLILQKNGVSFNNREILILGQNCYRDNSGYIRQSSPIIQIFPDGTFTTNDESKAATVSKLGLGHYRITGVLGYIAESV
ncbi:hypothetical protein Xbed_01918 [Xenorhabdus beddingii]|uniref:Phage tail protein C-terminal domain-containing protein n=1 Tax=Xenorhabdus beddingii TaxID=40578 RepID=A0A1Y2SM40_9GAMM|nr:hypothetical protein [Xenorhabdus beddingii]OTA19987.1 hypothetical protein Xbed_01918 [Xenorhabdus beddingii]